MALAAGSLLSGPLSPLLVAVMMLLIVGQCYCEHRYLLETDHDSEPEGSSVRLERDILDEGLDIVSSLVSAPGRGHQRNGAADGPEIFYTSCPSDASKGRVPPFQRRLMFFHRPGDSAKTELRLEETIGPKNQRLWNTNTIDLMISDYDFDLSKPTLMYTHGYLQDSREDFLMKARENYNKLQANRTKPSYNLLFFDWGYFAYGSYGECVAETPRSAKVLADFFAYLHQKHNYDLGQLHLISFSLSTHIAGQAARILAKRQRVGQITYLDPTGVCFHNHKSQKFGQKYGARDDDATLTVAKHYNKFGFGSYRDHVGRVNVQVNDGKTQRRAPSNRGALLEILRTLYPSHLYAVHHNNLHFKPELDCHDMAYECSSYESFLRGECGSCGKSNESCLLLSTVGNLELGIDLTEIDFKPDSQMFLTTGETQFCAYQYQVVLTLKSSPEAEVAKIITSGRFSFELGSGLLVQPRNQQGNRFTQLIRPNKRISAFPDQIDMSQHEKVVELIESISIGYLSHYSAEMRREWSARYCPDVDGVALIKCTK